MNVLNSVRTVLFLNDQRGLGEDLYRCRETGKVYIRQECDDNYVRWFTSSKWIGGYEADCPLREGLELRIVGKDKSPLFLETLSSIPGYADTVAKKIAPFSWEAVKNLSAERAKELGLQGYDDWKNWLLKSASEFEFSGENDNWLYGKSEREPIKKIEKLRYLGKVAWLTSQSEAHSVCNKKWTRFEIRSEDLITVEDLCGFSF